VPIKLKSLKQDGITIVDVMVDALYIKRADIRRDQQMRVGGILRTNGWTRERKLNPASCRNMVAPVLAQRAISYAAITAPQFRTIFIWVFDGIYLGI
jgi:hypothetical protein